MGIEIIGKLTQKNNGDFKLVDLENVDYDGTGKSAKQELEKKIETVKTDLGTTELTTTNKDIKGAINELGSQIKEKANSKDLEVERKRIDAFTALADGSTTGDAELIDGRVGSNGHIYENIGEHIREISANMKYVEPLNIYDKNTVIGDKYISITGEESTSLDGGNWCATDYIQIKQNRDIYIKTRTNLCFYDNKKDFISNIGSVGTIVTDGIISKDDIPSNASFIRFTIPSISSNNIAQYNIVAYDKQINFSDYFKSYYKIITENDVNELIQNPIKDIMDKIIIKTSNIFDSSLCTYGKFINRNNGKSDTAQADGYYVSDWISVNGGSKYFVSDLRSYAFYDADKIYISGGGRVTANTKNQIIEAPVNASFFRITAYVDDIETMYINEGDIDQGFDYPEILKYQLIEKYLKNENGFEDKIINCLGDSITYGYNGASDGDGVVGGRVEKPYPSILSEKLKCTVNNYGINGSTIGGDGTSKDSHGTLGYQPMNVRYADMSDADYIIVFGGTNDCYAGGRVPVGTKGDTTNLTFYGSLKILIEGLIRKYPTSKICFCTPLKRAITTPNDYGAYLMDYVNAIVDMCEEYGLPCLDLYRKSGCYPLISEFKTANLPDGLHPNQSYYYELTNKIEQFIRTL